MPMEEDSTAREEFERLAEAPDAEQAEAFLDALPDGETALTVSRLSEDEQTLLVNALEPEQAATLIEQVPEVQAVEIIERLEPEAAAAIIHELPSDEQADLLGELDEAEAEAILDKMAPDEARDARELVQYPHDVAGGLMIKPSSNWISSGSLIFGSSPSVRGSTISPASAHAAHTSGEAR